MNEILNGEGAEMRAQWDILQQKLSKQEIINKKLLERAIATNSDWLKNFMWGFNIFGILIALPCVFFLYKLGLYKEVCIFLGFGMLVVMLAHFYNTLITPRPSDASINVVKMEKDILRFRKVYVVNVWLGMIVLLIAIVWCFVLGVEWNSNVISATIGGVLGIVLGMCMNKKVLNHLRALREDLKTLNDWNKQ